MLSVTHGYSHKYGYAYLDHYMYILPTGIWTRMKHYKFIILVDS